jgi:RimJ/RimL family protein N-acetyltransferase
MQAAKERFGQLKLSAITHGENTASIKVLEALGFAHLGQKPWQDTTGLPNISR